MRRCVLVLAAAAAFDDVPFELRDVYGPPPAKPAVELPLLHEPRVKLWWPALDDVGGGAEIKRPPRSSTPSSRSSNQDNHTGCRDRAGRGQPL